MTCEEGVGGGGGKAVYFARFLNASYTHRFLAGPLPCFEERLTTRAVHWPDVKATCGEREGLTRQRASGRVKGAQCNASSQLSGQRDFLPHLFAR